MDRQEKKKLLAKFGKIPLDKRAVIYARYSTDVQTPESIERQVQLCSDYAQENGLTVPKAYCDKAKSGTQTTTRYNYNQMLEDSAEGLFSKIIVFKLDRFSRNLRDFLNDQYTLNENSVQILSTLEILPDGISGKLVKYSLIIGAELYSDSVADHTSSEMYRNARQGNYNGGKIPLGYRAVEAEGRKKYVIDDKESEIAAFIFEQYAQGKSYSDLVKLLDQRGWRTKNGDRFSTGSFNSIFNNRIYIGEYGYGKGTSKAVVTKIPELQIVPDKIFEKVQKRMAQNKVLAGRRRAKRGYILSGFVKCGVCDSNMHHEPIRSKGKAAYDCYRCPNTKKNDEHGEKLCDNLRIRRKYLERYVMDKIFRDLFGNASLQDVTERLNALILEQAQDSERELAEKEKLLKKNQQALKRLKTQKADGKHGLDWDDEVEKTNANIRELREAISKLENKRDSMTCKPNDVMRLIGLIRSAEIKKLQAPEIYEFMEAYLDSVTVDKEHVRVKLNLNKIVE